MKLGGVTGWLKRELMDMALYQKIVEQIKEFPHKVKVLQFAWLGEPLLHPNIAEMVKIAKKADIAETVSIVTNGSMLTKGLSDALIDAGLDRLRISLQGLNEQDYWDMSKYKIDYQEFIDNINYFYQNKKDTQLYIKIMDAMLKNKEDEEYFQKTFADKCDILNIEHLVPLVKELDLSDIKTDFQQGYFGNELRESKICSYSFFMLVVSPSGIVLPCANSDEVAVDGERYTMGMGDLKKETIKEFWDGKALQDFRVKMILGENNAVCKQCSYLKYHTADEDYLDGNEEKLLGIYQN